MNNSSRLRYFIYLSILIVGCTTGKSAFQKGDYDGSLLKAVNRLQSSPNNTEALKVLTSAYPLAVQSHLRKIDEAKLSNDVLRWEMVLREYEQLNRLSTEINSCPSCLNVIPNPARYTREIEEFKYKSAEARYALGMKLMNESTRLGAKAAYQHFERVQYFYPNFKDVQDQLDEAYWSATLKVLVRPAVVKSNYYRLSANYFSEQTNAFLQNYKGNKFVMFYTEEQVKAGKIMPDQVLELDFEDFSVGDTYVKEKVEKLKRDSVIIGYTRINEPIYGTVKAELSVFEKKVSSTGVLSMAIMDWHKKSPIKQKRLAGTYIWQDNWASYKGDERALSKQQLVMTKRKEVMPPPPAELFVLFTKPIYDQLVGEINRFYANY